MKKQYKYLLNENDIPKQWYNIVPDLPNPLPPQLNPQTMEPIGPEDLAPLFPMGLILQEVSDQNYIDIPEPVLDSTNVSNVTVAGMRLSKFFEG